MKHLSLLFTILVIFSSTLVSPTSCTKSNGVGLFVFGDSLFDPGNNNYLNGSIKGPSNNWPYGESYFKNPTGRLSDGRLVPDFIAEFMNLPICTPYLKPGAHQFTDGANFASAGAGVLTQTHPGTINLWLQLSYFKKVEKTLRQKVGATETKKFLGRAIYLFSIGGNDYFQFYSDYPNSTQFHKRQFIATVIGNFTAVLKEIHGMGGRKFGFQNAGPLGCVPSMLAKNVNSSGGCIDEASSLARLHNRELSVVLKKLKTKLPGFRYSIFDYYNSILERVNNPSKHAEFMNLPICTPYLKPGAHQFTDGANFATAGAGALVQTHPGTINLWLQLSYFKKVEKTLRQKIGATETKKFLGRAIYLFSIGGNDYFQFYSDYPNSTQFHKRQFIATVIGNFTAVLKEIHGMGGRKFGFQNAGPLGCVPSMLAKNVNSSGGCIDEASSLARLHNRELSVVLGKLKTKLPGFRYSIFDYYNSILERVNNPSKHGLKEGKSACCGSGAYRARFNCGRGTPSKDYQLCSNPNEYVWFDAAHTTQSANLQLATLLWNGSPEVTAPYNLKQFYQHFE
ncbi:GDSL lipase/esterase [Dillenia turbinata]|uniref:GDSL lipase/esterase n=1 Tax=Dillenia turbinata TaxID=194707 RepID=A0AAN8UFT1_9MAGN